MSKATQLLEKMVVGHVEGYPGAGKTTMMNHLKHQFPEFVFADLDWFRDKSIREVNRRKNRTLRRTDIYHLLDKSTLGMKYDHLTNKYLDDWVSKQTKPVVLFGWGANIIIDVVDPKGKILLNTKPLTIAVRNLKREREWEKVQEKPIPLNIKTTIQKFLRDVKESYKDRKSVRELGYEPTHKKHVAKKLRGISRRLNKKGRKNGS